MSGLFVPDIPTGIDIIGAAIKYADAGWYVGPCKQNDKSPGAILGAKWQHQTSRDPQQISAWFAGNDDGLFLHCGRSGALVLDVDEYQNLPEWAQDEIDRLAPPFQSTRDNDPNRGHYLFAMPQFRMISNGLGEMAVRGPDGRRVVWGEIRGRNGIIVVEPTRHEKASEGGRYKWERTGFLPHSAKITDALPDAANVSEPATDETVLAFLDSCVAESRPQALKAVLNRFTSDVESGHGRHQAAVECAVWAAREAAAGVYRAREAMESLGNLFVAAMEANPVSGRYPRSEYEAIWAWAVAQAMGADPETKAAEVSSRLEQPGKGFGTGKFLQPGPTEAAAVTDQPAADRHTLPPLPMPGRMIKDRYFDDKEAGIDIAQLADDVLMMGELAVGKDGMFWRYEGGVWREARDEVQNRVVRLLHGRYRGAHAANTEHVVASRVRRIMCDPVPNLINFQNTMLDWRTGELVDHDPDYLSTIQLPYDWDPKAECPKFDQFLKSILSDEFIDLIWEMLGYLLMSGNPLQQAFLFYGTGQNGKGTLMRVLVALLGIQNIATISLDSLNSNRFAPAGLFGMTANLAGDIDRTYQESSQSFKMLTGEDVFAGENKHRDAFKFKSWAVPVFSANEIPGSADTSEGYLRRWMVIRFARHIEETEKIYGYSDQLIGEVAGIAVKAVAALRTLMERGYFDKTRGEIAAEQAEFADKIDAVRRWVYECTTPSPGREEASTIYRSYKTWCDAQGLKPMSSPSLQDRLSNQGFPKRKSRGQRYVEGLEVTKYRVVGSSPAEARAAIAAEQPHEDRTEHVHPFLDAES